MIHAHTHVHVMINTHTHILIHTHTFVKRYKLYNND